MPPIGIMGENVPLINVTREMMWTLPSFDPYFIPSTVERLSIGDNSCNDCNVTVFDVSALQNLRELQVGYCCFQNVEEVKLIGLQELETVHIGHMSFTNHVGRNYNDPKRHFYLKHCPKVKFLFINYFSFSDYSVCEIEDVPSLELILMGSMDTDSTNFQYASLELRSERHWSALTIRHSQLDERSTREACIQFVLASCV